MKDQIRTELSRLEHQHNIRILYAVESGSRAWGFASTDSDWDVRYIYVHPLEWYLKIDDRKDSQELILPNDIDLAGWELRKALRLFRKSNPPILEWLNSPIVYLEKYPTAERMRELTKEYFNPKSCLHHYLNMADGNYRQYLQKEMVRVKKYFYALRPILACEWIRHINTMAPMEFRTLLESQVQDPSVANEIESLLVRKIAGEELNEEPRIQILNDYLEEKILFYKEYVKSAVASKEAGNDRLDELFRETLHEVWN